MRLAARKCLWRVFCAVAPILAFTGCGSIEIVAAPSWSEFNPAPTTDVAAATFRFVPVDLRAGAPKGVAHHLGETISVEAPAKLPGYLLVYVVTEGGPEQGIPVLDIDADHGVVSLPASEYAFGSGYLQMEYLPVPDRPDRDETLAVAGALGLHQFRFRTTIREAAHQISFRVRMLPGGSLGRIGGSGQSRKGDVATAVKGAQKEGGLP